jgi:tripartite-type tricarboxylate transporter receptor subunit TctC
MRLPRRRFLNLVTGAAALPAVSRLARAQTYPTRPVRWIVCFSAGGPNDIVARVIGQFLSDYLGQQFIIENRVGAGGNVGMQSALSSAPDGYTIAFVGPNNAINATLYERLPFDFIHDSAPIAGTMRLTNVMEVNLAVPANDIAEFIAYAKANPGKINFASGGASLTVPDVQVSRFRFFMEEFCSRRCSDGVGTSPHLSGELFKAMTGVSLVHVPYRGTAPALTDLLAGQVQVLFDNLPGSIGHIRTGKVRALGVTASKRVNAIPDVPTIGETVPGYEASVWYGMAPPKDTPPDIIEKLNNAVNAVLADPRLQARLAELGGEPMPMTPTGFGKLVAEETEKWAKVIRAANIKPE